MRSLFTLLLTLVCGMRVVMELITTMLSVFECVSVLITLSVRLLPLGRDIKRELILMLRPPVHIGLRVRLVLINVVLLLSPRVLVIMRSVSAAPFDDLGLQILTTSLCGKLFTLAV